MVGFLRKQCSVSINSKRTLNIKRLRSKSSKGKRLMLAETVQQMFSPKGQEDPWDTLEVSDDSSSDLDVELPGEGDNQLVVDGEQSEELEG